MNIKKALDALGPTVETVRDFFRARGLKGSIGKCRKCIVANYLRTLGIEASVNTFEVINTGMDLEEVETPIQVAEFIHNFDRGEYPELVIGASLP